MHNICPMNDQTSGPACVSSSSSRIANRAMLVLYFALLAAIVANAAISMHPRFLNLADSVDSQKAILERRPFVELSPDRGI
jgi:hypothetical protein